MVDKRYRSVDRTGIGGTMNFEMNKVKNQRVCQALAWFFYEKSGVLIEEGNRLIGGPNRSIEQGKALINRKVWLINESN